MAYSFEEFYQDWLDWISDKEQFLKELENWKNIFKKKQNRNILELERKCKMNMQTYRIGIDLGGTNIKVGIVNKKQEIIASASRKTRKERPYQEVLDDMAETVKDA